MGGGGPPLCTLTWDSVGRAMERGGGIKETARAISFTPLKPDTSQIFSWRIALIVVKDWWNRVSETEENRLENNDILDNKRLTIQFHHPHELMTI